MTVVVMKQPHIQHVVFRNKQPHIQQDTEGKELPRQQEIVMVQVTADHHQKVVNNIIK